MAYNEAANKAAQKYKRENIKRVPLDMQITEYESVRAAAAAKGEKVNEYIKKAVRDRMARDAQGIAADDGVGAVPEDGAEVSPPSYGFDSPRC